MPAVDAGPARSTPAGECEWTGRSGACLRVANALRAAFAQANLSAETEVSPAAHGWCPPGTLLYDCDQSEKAWGRMPALFERALA